MTETTYYKKELAVIQSSSLRELVERVNSLGIQREDLVTVFEKDETFFLLYYK